MTLLLAIKISQSQIRNRMLLYFHNLNSTGTKTKRLQLVYQKHQNNTELL